MKLVGTTDNIGFQYIRAGELAAKVVADQANAHKSDRAIARETGVSSKTVGLARRAAGIENPIDAGPTKVEKATAAIVANPEKSNRAIARETGVNERTVRRARDLMNG